MQPEPMGSAAALRYADSELAFLLERVWIEGELDAATFESVLLVEEQHLEVVVELPPNYELSVRAATHTPDGYDLWTIDVTEEAAARARAFRREHIPTHETALECAVELRRIDSPLGFPVVTMVLRAPSIEWVVDNALSVIRERCGLRLAPFGREAE